MGRGFRVKKKKKKENFRIKKEKKKKHVRMADNEKKKRMHNSVEVPKKLNIVLPCNQKFHFKLDTPRVKAGT